MKRGCIISIYAKRQHKTTRPALSIGLRSPHMLLPQIPSGNFDVTVSTSATLFSSPSAIQCSNRKTASDKNATQIKNFNMASAGRKRSGNKPKCPNVDVLKNKDASSRDVVERSVSGIIDVIIAFS
mmetsp:Transcript_32348/g.43041  ORF Transcript_32348/g.43041 Transcript_32348/m.43041 type:complete len:126 (-) Transcript_32348:412-789(-)